MAPYSVLFKPSVEKDLRHIPKSAARRIWAKIEALSRDPLPSQSIKLSGAETLYRLRVGDYRVIYGVSHVSRQVVVHYIRHRKDAYRGL